MANNHIDNTVRKLEEEAKEQGLSSEEREAYMKKINGLVSGIFTQIDLLHRNGNTGNQILEAANLQVELLNQSGKALLKDKNTYLEEKKNTLQELENSKGVISDSTLPPNSFTASEFKKRPSLSSILPQTNRINFWHRGVAPAEPITTKVFMKAINEIAEPIKAVEHFVGEVINNTVKKSLQNYSRQTLLPFCRIPS
jgi:hypothetical protein